MFSGYRHVVYFGLLNLVAVVILARSTMDGFASLWCAYAALTAGAITLHLRLAAPHRDAVALGVLAAPQGDKGT
jgi:hypothetical protein